MKSFGGRRVVRWLEAPRELDKGRHSVDHVHYNKEGYRIWDGVLFPVVEECLGWRLWNEVGVEGTGEVTLGGAGVGQASKEQTGKAAEKAVETLVKQSAKMKVPKPVAAPKPATPKPAGNSWADLVRKK